MPAGNDFCNNELINAVFQNADSDEERGVPKRGKVVYRTDTDTYEGCYDESPDPDENGGGTWGPLGLAETLSTAALLITAPTSSPSGYTSTGVHARVGHLQTTSMAYVFGSGAAAGLGTYQFGLPRFPYPLGSATGLVGHAVLKDASSGAVEHGDVYLSGSIAHIEVDGVLVDDASPWVWANGDTIDFHATYRSV